MCRRVAHLSPSDVDADTLSEYQLHVGRVAQLDHRPDRQVHPLLSRAHATQLGALVHRRVPGSLQLYLEHNNVERFPPSATERGKLEHPRYEY